MNGKVSQSVFVKVLVECERNGNSLSICYRDRKDAGLCH